MTAPTHIVTGLAAVVAVGHTAGVTPQPLELAAFLVGCLAPDIDGEGVVTRPGTILRRLFGRGIGNVLDAAFEFVSRIVNLLFGHRGFVHSPLLSVCIIALGAGLGKSWLIWFGVGYAAHLLGDALTAGGIPAWSPVSSKRVSLSPMRTGSRTEKVLALVLLFFTCSFGWVLLPEDVKETHRMVYHKLAGK